VYLIRFSGLPGFYTLVQASTCVYEAVGFFSLIDLNILQTVLVVVSL
jgi:hypothetical protein